MLDITAHIFQNVQVTSNKMVHKKRHHFLTQFSIPFHLVRSVLLRVLAQKTTFRLLEILRQPITSFYSMVFKARNTRNKTEQTVWKVWKAAPENGIFSCVSFCWRSLGRFARCVQFHSKVHIDGYWNILCKGKVVQSLTEDYLPVHWRLL